ncbi:hypothetical protein HYV12_00545 [Candidatus Dojkabacteria bacterium]|nr:hypothetical protein [Candidatus Dojkabacteria bacterium]
MLIQQIQEKDWEQRPTINEKTDKLALETLNIQDQPTQNIAIQLTVANHICSLYQDMNLPTCIAGFTPIYYLLIGTRYRMDKPMDESFKTIFSNTEITEQNLLNLSAYIIEQVKEKQDQSDDEIKQTKLVEQGRISAKLEKDGSVSLHIGDSGTLEYESIRNDLRQVLTILKTNHPYIKLLSGESWLYSTKTIWMFLPEELQENITIITRENVLRSGALWGQFIQPNTRLEQTRKYLFLKRIGKVTSINDLYNAFPFPVSSINVPIEKLYNQLAIAKK